MNNLKPRIICLFNTTYIGRYLAVASLLHALGFNARLTYHSCVLFCFNVQAQTMYNAIITYSAQWKAMYCSPSNTLCSIRRGIFDKNLPIYEWAAGMHRIVLSCSQKTSSRYITDVEQI